MRAVSTADDLLARRLARTVAEDVDRVERRLVAGDIMDARGPRGNKHGRTNVYSELSIGDWTGSCTRSVQWLERVVMVGRLQLETMR